MGVERLHLQLGFWLHFATLIPSSLNAPANGPRVFLGGKDG